MKTMNHTDYAKACRTKTEAELRFTIQDAAEAVRANPDGENAGYYADEVNYASSELFRRRNVDHTTGNRS